MVVGVGPGELRDFIAGVFFPAHPSNLNVGPRHDDAGLQARLQNLATSLPHGHLAAVAVDLQTGATASVDARRVFPAASLFKLPILMQVLDAEASGRIDPEQQVQIRPEDWTDGSGVLQARIGDRLSVRELTRLMIQESDNIAALVLLDVVGTQNVNALAQQLGLADTHVVDHRAGEPGDHTTTAEDMAHLLVSLATGQAISAEVSDQAIGLMQARQSVSWLADDVPFWVKVAHKWGDLPDARHDVGIVYTPHGAYVLAVLTENSLPDEAASAIARASRMMYEYLGGNGDAQVPAT